MLLDFFFSLLQFELPLFILNSNFQTFINSHVYKNFKNWDTINISLLNIILRYLTSFLNYKLKILSVILYIFLDK